MKSGRNLVKRRKISYNEIKYSAATGFETVGNGKASGRTAMGR
jgi:hypothetical protein